MLELLTQPCVVAVGVVGWSGGADGLGDQGGGEADERDAGARRGVRARGVDPGHRGVGAEPLPFLSSPSLALWALAITTIWWSIGLPMLLFLAGLQQVPADLYEAAALDRASRWRTFASITVPALDEAITAHIVLGGTTASPSATGLRANCSSIQAGVMVGGTRPRSSPPALR